MPTRQPKTVGAWAPYAPTERAPWNARRVAHLHRRAGFGVTWGEVLRDLKDGPTVSIDRVLAGKTRPPGGPEDFDRVAGALADAAVASNDPAQLKAWWVYRMLLGPDPLGEQLTLLWHNHFATSNLKVKSLGAMRRQNDVLRGFARAPFGELLRRVVRDPALLVWLDAPLNSRARPNENLARELMELFTLGIGHYTESDVKEAARALTGWTVADGRFEDVTARHDPGDKTVLGKTGKWRGADLVRLLLEHPATSERLAARVCELLMGEGAVGAAARRALAAGLRERDLDVGWAVETVLRSEAFFAEANLGRRVAGPAEFVVGSARALERLEVPPGTLALADWTSRLGQDLFYPPNVGGWQGGRAWLSTRTLLERVNYSAALVGGKGVGRDEPPDLIALARRHGHGRDLGSVLDFFAKLLLAAPPDGAWRDRVLAALGPRAALEPAAVRRGVCLILALPQAHLA